MGSGRCEVVQKFLVDFFLVVVCYMEVVVVGSFKKINVFLGDFDKINCNYLDKVYFISDKNLWVNLFYVLLNEMQ